MRYLLLFLLSGCVPGYVDNTPADLVPIEITIIDGGVKMPDNVATRLEKCGENICAR